MAGTPTSRLDASIFDLCGRLPLPLRMTGMFRLWMTYHFSSTSLIVDQDQAIQNAVWTSDPKTTGLVIESYTRWNTEETEKRPAVIIKRNAWKRLRLGIGDRMQGLTEPDGQPVYGNAWQGSHTLFCIAGRGAEAEKLAAEVFCELNEQNPVVRAANDLLRLEVTEVGDLFILDQDARQDFAVPVVVGYGFMESWRIQQEVPIANRIDLALLEP